MDKERNKKGEPVILPKNGRGYYGVGIYLPKSKKNIGTIFRSAFILGAKFIFTIGERYDWQKTDTVKSYRNIPLFHYSTFDEFYNSFPKECKLIGVELCERSIPLTSFVHPERSIYLLGAEDYGLPKEITDKCNAVVQLPGEFSLNVSVAGSIVMYDRIKKALD